MADRKAPQAKKQKPKPVRPQGPVVPVAAGVRTEKRNLRQFCDRCGCQGSYILCIATWYGYGCSADCVDFGLHALWACRFFAALRVVYNLEISGTFQQAVPQCYFSPFKKPFDGLAARQQICANYQVGGIYPFPFLSSSVSPTDLTATRTTSSPC